MELTEMMMMAQTGKNGLNDTHLVAYLDGELSQTEKEAIAAELEQNPELRERLVFLQHGERPFGEAFDMLLDAAPDDKLQAMFVTLVAEQDKGGEGRTDDGTTLPVRRWPAWQMVAAAAVFVVVFAGGMVTGTFLKPDQPIQQQTARGWREAVAQYVSLFARSTLDGMPTDRAAQEDGLRRVSTALGLELSVDRIAAPSLAFKGTQLLQLNGKPIVQIAYLWDGQTPVAFCIVKSAEPPQPAATEKRYGLNIVHWRASGYGFMVIGNVPEDQLLRLARPLEARFG